MNTKRLRRGYLLLIPLLLISVISSCNGLRKPIEMNRPADRETMIEEQRPFQTSSAFDVRSSITVEFFYSPERKLILTGGDSLQLANIASEERDGVLHIYTKENKRTWANRQDLCAKIYTPEIKSINLSGATDAFLRSEFLLPELAISLSGSSDFEARRINVRGLLRLEASGSSDTYIGGRVDALEANLRGSSDLNASHLAPLRIATIHASGSSDTELGEVRELHYVLTGASDLEYMGKPEVLQGTLSGASSISRK